MVGVHQAGPTIMVGPHKTSRRRSASAGSAPVFPGGQSMKDHKGMEVTRRTVLGGAAAVAAGGVMPALSSATEAAQENHTLVIAAPATPQSLDHEFDVSLGTIDAVGALYDNLLEYEKVADQLDPEAL